jgi:hypothetical protein
MQAIIEFVAELEGGWPMLDFCEEGEGWSSEWLQTLKKSITAGAFEEAIGLCLPHAAASFLVGEVPVLFDSDEPVAAYLVRLQGPSVETIDDSEAIVFRRWTAHFRLPICINILREWVSADEHGVSQWSLERYEAWLETHDIWGLQDGVRFSLWDVSYDLDGMGENHCMPDAASVACAIAAADSTPHSTVSPEG